VRRYVAIRLRHGWNTLPQWAEAAVGGFDKGCWGGPWCGGAKLISWAGDLVTDCAAAGGKPSLPSDPSAGTKGKVAAGGSLCRVIRAGAG